VNPAQEAGQILAAKRKELFDLQAQYDTGKIHPELGIKLYDYPEGVEQQIDQRLAELKVLNDKYVDLSRAQIASDNEKAMNDLQQIDRKYNAAGLGWSPDGGGQISGLGKYKSLGEFVVNSHEYKLRKQSKGRFVVEIPGVDFKLLVGDGRSPGYTPVNARTDIVVPYPNRPLRVVDLIPVTPTDLTSVKWMEETTFTNNASMTGEGYTKPESVLDWTERTSPVRKIAHIMQVSDEIMDDIPGFMSLINNDMVLMLGLKEEQQVLNGTGVGQELTGFLQVSTLQTQTFSTNNADTILKAMTKVQWTGYGNVTGIIMNPNNWETTRLIKGATNQDYVLGSPLIDVTPRLWGVPVVVTNAITAGTALVGDFSMFSEIRRKQGVTIDVSDSHSTNFALDILALRAEMREALLIKRGSAFCQATSLT
jgi:hypothetical protein